MAAEHQKLARELLTAFPATSPELARDGVWADVMARTLENTETTIGVMLEVIWHAYIAATALTTMADLEADEAWPKLFELVDARKERGGDA